MLTEFELKKNWQFKLSQCSEVIPHGIINPDNWYAANVPGTIHTDLLHNDMINDPFYADNEKHLSWIADQSWVYKTIFDYPKTFEKARPVYLEFGGLDTIAEIYLNDQLLGTCDNMFRSHRFDVKNILQENENELVVHFSSAIKYACDEMKQHGELFSARHPQRVYLRKAQYSFGWDWGPIYPTCGIWRPVRLLQTGSIEIQHVKFETVSLRDQKAQILIGIEASGHTDKISALDITLAGKKHTLEKSVTENLSFPCTITMEVSDAELWWPNGAGDQNLYNLTVTVSDPNRTILDQRCVRVGIRTVTLLTEERKKSVFKFKINDVSIYMQGANWIPADSFLPRVQSAKYQQLVTMARDANMNMLRVWGGGIYEDDYFYELCDELGLLVWQDFMFACASYPYSDRFKENITEEIHQNIRRLQNHPSLAIWCGNNENEWIWFREEMGTIDQMPGFKIFHELMPQIIKEIDPYRPYWPTSPFGNDEDPNDFRSGNRHQWDIWSRWVDYSEIYYDQSHFVTEFGFQAPANLTTYTKALSVSDRQSQSEIFEFHNKQDEGNARLFRFLAAHLPVRSKWRDYIYLTQLNQGFALKSCLEHWRTRWPETAGSIIWQLNDCWPVTSWSLIDSELMPKISYYFVKRAFAPVFIYLNSKYSDRTEYSIMNQGKKKICGKLSHCIMNLRSGKTVEETSISIAVNPNSKQDFEPVEKLANDRLLVVTFYNNHNEIVSRNYVAAKRWKHMPCQTAKIQCKILEQKIQLTSDRLSLFVDPAITGTLPSDRGFIMLPGEVREIKCHPANGTKTIDFDRLELRTLNDYLSG